MKQPKFTTVRLANDTHRKLKAEAEKKGMLVTRLVNVAVEFYLDAQSKSQTA